MTYPELRRGDVGDDVAQAQSQLNRTGAMLVVDGDFGLATERGVCYTQALAGMEPSGTMDQAIWAWSDAQPDPYPPLATEGVALIAREESGGLAYYEAVARWPHCPGGASGITIGMGYDLRFQTEADFRGVWGPHLTAQALGELARDIGRRGTKARATELKRLGIEVPVAAAWSVLIGNSLPRYHGLTGDIYSSLPRLPALCRAVLVSIVYNRGNGLIGPSRLEMRAIRDLLAEADEPTVGPDARRRILSQVEDEILSMQRLWDVTSGLRKRRQAEANLWRKGLREM